MAHRAAASAAARSSHAPSPTFAVRRPTRYPPTGDGARQDAETARTHAPYHASRLPDPCDCSRPWPDFLLWSADRICPALREPSPGRRARAYKTARRLWIRSEEHTSELQSLMRISYAVFCLKKKKINTKYNQ